MANLDQIPSETLAAVEKVLEPFRLSDEKLKDISERLLKDMIKGLSGDDKMFSSYVEERPNGTEEGDFLALDMGGTNLRVFYVKVTKGKGELKKDGCKEKEIPDEIKEEENGEKVFDFIVEHLSEFLDSKNLKGQTLPLSFSFSFPCYQESLYKCILKKWAKGFNCGMEGEDVAELLKKAIKRKGNLNIEDQIIMVNDAVATMMSCEDKNCEIGMIIGTGTNASYMEEKKNTKDGGKGQMCINTEWCSFGDDHALDEFLTEFDTNLDKDSENSGEHIVEKMIGGMYLGEIVRLVLVKLTKENLLFNRELPKALSEPMEFKAPFMSDIEKADSGLENAKKLLECESVDAKLVQLVCETISLRSARLCAAALATMANRIRTNRGKDDLEITVAMDGSLYKKHPTENLKKALPALAPECKITIKEVKDASGIGAAMIAAVDRRLKGGKE